MRSIGARIAVWYACAATATLALLFAAGYVLLERQLLRGLDLLNESEFQQIEARLGPDYSTLSAPFIETVLAEPQAARATATAVAPTSTAGPTRTPAPTAIPDPERPVEYRYTSANGGDILRCYVLRENATQPRLMQCVVAR